MTIFTNALTCCVGGNGEAKSPLKSPTKVKLDPNVEYEDVEEFYVKYKN